MERQMRQNYSFSAANMIDDFSIDFVIYISIDFVIDFVIDFSIDFVIGFRISREHNHRYFRTWLSADCFVGVSCWREYSRLLAAPCF